MKQNKDAKEEPVVTEGYYTTTDKGKIFYVLTPGKDGECDLCRNCTIEGRATTEFSVLSRKAVFVIGFLCEKCRLDRKGIDKLFQSFKSSAIEILENPTFWEGGKWNFATRVPFTFEFYITHMATQSGAMQRLDLGGDE
jgi:hypothetical protein